MGTDLETIFDLGLEDNNKIDEIKKAKLLLKENGYIVKKWTKSMDEDANECEEMDSKGQSKDYCGCSCSICLAQ